MTVRSLMVQLVLLASCAPESQTVVTLPAVVTRAALTGLTNVTGRLTIEQGGRVVGTWGPTVAQGDVVELHFDAVPPGTYLFRVLLSGDFQSATDVALLEYEQPNVIIQAGGGNTIAATGGAWRIATDRGVRLDRDGDGVDDVTEVLRGLDPGTAMTRVREPADSESFLALSGTDLRALFALTASGIYHLGDQRRTTVVDADLTSLTALLPPPNPVRVDLNPNGCGATFTDFAVVGGRIVAGAQDGCIFMDDFAAALDSIVERTWLVEHSLLLQGHASVLQETPALPAPPVVSTPWQSIALSTSNNLPWSLGLVFADGQAGFCTEAATQATSQTWEVRQDYNGLDQTDWQLVDGLADCGIETPVIIGGGKFFSGSGFSGLVPPGTSFADLAHWRDGGRCRLLLAYADPTNNGVASVFGVSCDATNPAACTDHQSAGVVLGPSGNIIPSAAVVGRSAAFEAGTGSSALALFVGDEDGNLHASLIEGGLPNSAWTLVASTPDGEPIRALAALPAHDTADETGPIHTVFVLTPSHVYRVP